MVIASLFAKIVTLPALSHYSMPNIKKDYKVSATAPSVPTPIINDDGGLSVLYYGPTQGFKLIFAFCFFCGLAVFN